MQFLAGISFAKRYEFLIGGENFSSVKTLIPGGKKEREREEGNDHEGSFIIVVVVIRRFREIVRFLASIRSSFSTLFSSYCRVS